MAIIAGTGMQIGSQYAKPGSGTQKGLQYGGMGLSMLGGMGLGGAGGGGLFAGIGGSGTGATAATAAGSAGAASSMSIAPGLLDSTFAGLAPSFSSSMGSTLPTFSYQPMAQGLLSSTPAQSTGFNLSKLIDLADIGSSSSSEKNRQAPLQPAPPINAQLPRTSLIGGPGGSSFKPVKYQPKRRY